MLISFSGLDGAGKSTLISHLTVSLEKKGYRVVILTMYDHISFYAFLRMMRNKFFTIIGRKHSENLENISSASEDWNNWLPDSKGRKPRDPKIGTGDKKTIFQRLLYGFFRSSIVRRFILFFDVLMLLILRFFHEVFHGRVLITDRYIYDTLADISDLESRKWFFVKNFLKIVPEPDLAVFVDVDPETAYARKKEYPVEYMEWRRNTYLRIFGWLNNPFILMNDDLDNACNALTDQASRLL